MEDPVDIEVEPHKNAKKSVKPFYRTALEKWEWDFNLSWDLKKTICWEMGLGTPPPFQDPLNLFSVKIYSFLLQNGF